MAKKILIVEDQPFIALDIEQLLTILGYEVLNIVSTGEAALKITDNLMPDLILMDIRLAGQLNGIEAAKLIKQKHHLPIIFLTGHSDNDLLEQAKQVNPAGYLLKPFNDKQLYSTIEIAFSNQQNSPNLNDKIFPRQSKPVNLLIIEDDLLVLKNMQVFLSDLDFNVLEAKNGRQGLDIFHRQKPDIVITDLRMPEMNGLELISIITKESPDTPIIVTSGIGNISEAVEAIKVGAWEYITKPIIDLSILEHAIQQTWQKAVLVKQNQQYQLHLQELVKQKTEELQKANNKLTEEISTHKLAEQEREKLIKTLKLSLKKEEQAHEQMETAYAKKQTAYDGLEQTQKELLSTNKKLSRILESLSSGFFVLNKNMLITYFNKAAEKLLGKAKQEVLARHMFNEVFPEAKGSVFDSHFTLALQEKKNISFKTYFDIAPYKNWYNVSVYPFEDGISVYFQISTDSQLPRLKAKA